MTHPTTRHLMEHAAGSISSGMGLLVATHLTLCPKCRSKTARLEAIGGALLAEERPTSMKPPDLAATLARIETAFEPRPAREEKEALSCFPRPIQQALSAGGKIPHWKRLMPGLWGIRVPSDSSEDVRLLKGRPGTRILTHTHEGEEATLVLAGHLRDGEQTFGRGEVSLCGPEHDHHPEVVGSEDCFCLIVLGGKLRFTGRWAPILNLLPQ